MFGKQWPLFFIELQAEGTTINTKINAHGNERQSHHADARSLVSIHSCVTGEVFQLLLQRLKPGPLFSVLQEIGDIRLGRLDTDGDWEM